MTKANKIDKIHCMNVLSNIEIPRKVGEKVQLFMDRMNNLTWDSKEQKEKVLKKLSIAQIGSEYIDQKIFEEYMAFEVIKNVFPLIEPKNEKVVNYKKAKNVEEAILLANIAYSFHDEYIDDMWMRMICDMDRDEDSRLYIFRLVAKIALKALIKLNSPGCEFLFLINVS